MPTPSPPHVAVILPPTEGFGPRRSGVVAQVAHRLTRTPGFQTTVFGIRQERGFDDVTFRGIAPLGLLPGTINLKYMASLVLPLARLRPALIEVHDAVGVALGLARLFRSTPVTLFLHGDPPAMRRLRTPAERTEVMTRMARVVCASDFQRNRLLDGLAAPTRPPDLLPYGIDLASLPPFRRRERMILFAGRIVPENGPDTFVHACATALQHLPGWRAEMIGAHEPRVDSPETAYVREVRAAAQGAGVNVLGYRDQPDVLLAMGRAAMTVMPSRWAEPFGLTALEAMASGSALVCAPAGALREIVGDAALYADAEKPSAVAAAIRSLGRDEPRRGALAEAARARVRQFDLPAVLDRLAAMRHEILGIPPGTGG